MNPIESYENDLEKLKKSRQRIDELLDILTSNDDHSGRREDCYYVIVEINNYVNICDDVKASRSVLMDLLDEYKRNKKISN